MDRWLPYCLSSENPRRICKPGSHIFCLSIIFFLIALGVMGSYLIGLITISIFGNWFAKGFQTTRPAQDFVTGAFVLLAGAAIILCLCIIGVVFRPVVESIKEEISDAQKYKGVTSETSQI